MLQENLKVEFVLGLEELVAVEDWGLGDGRVEMVLAIIGRRGRELRTRLKRLLEHILMIHKGAALDLSSQVGAPHREPLVLEVLVL